MTTPTFTPPIAPSNGLKAKQELSLLKATFGDGYEQAAPNGLNSLRKVYDLSWEALSVADAQTIVSFFETQGGYQAFLYTIPGDATPMKFTCDTWAETYSTNLIRGVTATFKQSFNL